MVGVLLAISGCSSNDESRGPGTESSSQPTTRPDSDPTSGSTDQLTDQLTGQPTDDPSGDPTDDPGVAAATGQKIVLRSGNQKVLTFHLPKARWRVYGNGIDANLNTGDGRWDFHANAVSSFDSTTLAFLARGSVRLFRSMALKAERVQNRTLDGAVGYVVEGASADRLNVEFGSIYNGWTVSLRFAFPARAPEAREWIDSVLASVEWV